MIQYGGMPAISRGLRQARALPPGYQTEVSRPRSGVAGVSIEISRIIFQSSFGEHLDQFLAERLYPMMFLLTVDVMLHRLARGGTDGEGRIAFLPCKRAQPK